MKLERPDLRDVAPDVRAYIEALEAEMARVRKPGAARPARAPQNATVDPPEAPTTLQVVTLSAEGVVKRTPRHLYSRQRRGGMGVFDLDLTEGDAPSLLSVLDVAETALLFTDQGRAFRLPVQTLPEDEVHARGKPLPGAPLRSGERVIALLPADAGAQVALVSERGRVRRVRASFVGSHLIPGMGFHDPKSGGPLVAACWTSGEDDLFVATRSGQAIRFPEQRVHDSGSLGIRLERDDAAVAIAAVQETSGVFLLGADGKGTVRLMEGFRANKSPGGGGKVALKTEHLVGAVTVTPEDDLFVISQLSKIIRFAAAEVPGKTGAVQGVNCMALRSDATAAVAVGRVGE